MERKPRSQGALLLKMEPMFRISAILAAIVVLAASTQATAKDHNQKLDKDLARQIEAILGQPELEPSLWGIDVVSLAATEPSIH